MMLNHYKFLWFLVKCQCEMPFANVCKRTFIKQITDIKRDDSNTKRINSDTKRDNSEKSSTPTSIKTRTSSISNKVRQSNNNTINN